MTSKRTEAEFKPEPKPAGLTEAQVRAIVREELASWKHDAGHSATANREAAQRARDEASGVAS